MRREPLHGSESVEAHLSRYFGHRAKPAPTGSFASAPSSPPRAAPIAAPFPHFGSFPIARSSARRSRTVTLVSPAIHSSGVCAR
jgi:hypothetical protein